MTSLFTAVSRDPVFRKMAGQTPPTVITVDNVLNHMEDARARHIAPQQLLESPKIPPADNVFVEVFSPTLLVVPHPAIPSGIPLASDFAAWIVVYRTDLQRVWDAMRGDSAIDPQARVIIVAKLFEERLGILPSITATEALDEHGFPLEYSESILVDVAGETLKRARDLRRLFPGLPANPHLAAIDAIWGPHLTPWENALYFLNTGQATLQNMDLRQQRLFVQHQPLAGVTFKTVVFKPGPLAQFNRPRQEIPELD